MLRKVGSLFAVVLCALALTASVYAEEMKGTISKVGNDGREITVKTKSGKEKTVKISGSRTTLEGIKSRAELKEGQSVSVEHDGDAAKKVKVAK
jgi:hypothetical protein